MIKEEIKKFEDRYGAPEFEAGQDSSLEKFKARKEKNQMKKYGIKPTDTDIDVADLVARDVLSKVIAEETPKQELDVKSLYNQENDVDEEEDNNDKMDDAKKELRIKMMQYLNPRIVKSGELKNYVNRANIKEQLNDIATAKLDLYKKALAINATVDLSEGNIATKEKSRNVRRQIGTAAYIKSLVPTGPESALQRGRMVMSNPKVSSQKIAGLYRNLPNFKTPESMRDEHDALHNAADSLSLAEGNKVTKEKLKNYVRSLGKKAVEAGSVPYDQRHSPLRYGRKELINTPESMRAEHDALHAASIQEETEQLDEAKRNPNIMKQGRTKVVKARVRGGKVQRRKRLSAVKGYTIRGGKLKRMSAQERLRRKRGQRRGKIKRKAKMARALMRRKRSMRRRASLGLKE